MAKNSSDIADEYEEKVILDMKKVEYKFYEILLQKLAEFSEGGKLVADPTKLAQLEATIRQALKDAGYSKAVDNYFEAFPAIVNLNQSYYRNDDIAIKPLVNDSELVKNTYAKIEEDLRKGGVNKAIVTTIAEQMRQGILLNSSYQDAADAIRNTLIEKQLPTKYVFQATSDAIKMYNGAIQDEVKIRYNATHFYYVVGLKETSRPFCVHMKDKYGSRAIAYTELAEDLKEYCPNGQPSQESITFTTIDGVTETKKKGSGMMENTFTYNFSQKTGGYQCRHDAIPIPGKLA